MAPVPPAPDWEYAFYLFLRIHAILPHGDNKITPNRIIAGHDAEVNNLHTFGCRVYALPLTRRDGKVTTDNIIKVTIFGTLLG
jgi:hypothetical protein